MLERFLAALALGIIDHLSRRTARDADPDSALLQRGGASVREWLHANRARSRVKPDQDRTRDASADLCDD
jgi:hypothetical protein